MPFRGRLVPLFKEYDGFLSFLRKPEKRSSKICFKALLKQRLLLAEQHSHKYACISLQLKYVTSSLGVLHVKVREIMVLRPAQLLSFKSGTCTSLLVTHS